MANLTHPYLLVWHPYRADTVLVFLQCDRTTALDVLFRQLLAEDVPRVGVVGCGCSVATEPTAEVSHYYNVTHVRTLVQNITLQGRHNREG